jgi:hypothetical protein
VVVVLLTERDAEGVVVAVIAVVAGVVVVAAE